MRTFFRLLLAPSFFLAGPLFGPEERESMILNNIVEGLPDYTASHLRR
jgi:hypothetical protein